MFFKGDGESYIMEVHGNSAGSGFDNLSTGNLTVMTIERVAGDYLVVGDSDKPSTWHLPVKDNGAVNHRLMGAAWAALHGGYRGNKYEGPDKQKALAKLKALYKSEGMELPNEKEYIPSDIYSFEQYKDYTKKEKSSDEVIGLTEIYKQLLDNIVINGDNIIEFVKSLSNDYIEKMTKIIDSKPIEETDVLEKFSESTDGVILIQEAERRDSALLKMHIKLIEPGWGNQKDNNYYPKEMLQRDAYKFIGAKMFPVDHREDGKSVGSWVSNITNIVGFTETGAPIAEVAVIDPVFADKVRSISKAGLLGDLQCSIMASGVAEDGFELNGRKGKKVVEIKQAGDVDWVRRAGAGGMALTLLENAEIETEESMKEGVEILEQETEKSVELTETKEVEEVIEEKSEDIQEKKESEPVEIHEKEQEMLSQGRVTDILAESKLTDISQKRLARNKYASEEEVMEAIKLECEYLDAVTEAGKPFGLDGAQAKPKKLTEQEVEELKNQAVKESLSY